MKHLIGKTIKSISKKTTKGTWGDEFEVMYIRFTDGTTLKITSWDYESYCSGLETKII